jgi:hypothetical protein
MRAPALAQLHEIFLGQGGSPFELVAGKHYLCDTANAEIQKDASLAYKITRISLVPLSRRTSFERGLPFRGRQVPGRICPSLAQEWGLSRRPIMKDDPTFRAFAELASAIKEELKWFEGCAYWVLSQRPLCSPKMCIHSARDKG